jgi:PIN domain
MPNTITPYQKYEFKAHKTYFLDNNIWIALFAPLINSNQYRQRKASSFLKNVQSYNSQIALISLIVSEFTNTSARFFFNLWKNNTQNYSADYKKDYKQNTSSSYENDLSEVKIMLEKICNLDFVEKYPDNFNAVNIDNIINNFEIDFNDAYYLELCRKNNWILVTSDNDFDNIDCNITIVKI